MNVKDPFLVSGEEKRNTSLISQMSAFALSINVCIKEAKFLDTLINNGIYFFCTIFSVAVSNKNVICVVVLHAERYRRHEHHEHHIIDHRGRQPAHFIDNSNIEDELNDTVVIRDDDQDSEVSKGEVSSFLPCIVIHKWDNKLFAVVKTFVLSLWCYNL